MTTKLPKLTIYDYPIEVFATACKGMQYKHPNDPNIWIIAERHTRGNGNFETGVYVDNIDANRYRASLYFNMKSPIEEPYNSKLLQAIEDYLYPRPIVRKSRFENIDD